MYVVNIMQLEVVIIIELGFFFLLFLVGISDCHTVKFKLFRHITDVCTEIHKCEKCHPNPLFHAHKLNI